MNRRALKLGALALAAPLVTLVSVGHAYADYAPQPSDVVGLGGDTPQYAVDFVFNGDVAGDTGYNLSKVNRAVYFDAVPDGNGRAAYTNNVTTGANSVALNATDVLRAGSSPVQRNQSSGAGLTALLADTGATETINFVASASLPSAAQQTAAGTNGWGFLHVVEIGTDSVGILASSGTTPTNAPANLSISQLLSIYTGAATTWNQVGGTSTASIVPEIPPSSSAIYKTLIADLTTANGGTAPTLSSSVKTVEQNDPSVVSSNPNAIVPFSVGRLSLWNSGYFHNPATVFPGGGSISPGASLIAGYTSPITDYIIFRNSDLASTTPFQPGGTLNWAQTLFSNSGGSTPFFGRAAAQTLLTAAGITPNYQDLGNVHS
jgi:ABC-type phosphate transport system substrate-binding protein